MVKDLFIFNPLHILNSILIVYVYVICCIYIFLCLSNRMRIFLLAEYFPCECGRVYKLKTSLNSHRRYECGKPPQFPCPHCPYRAKLKGTLKSHVLLKHGNVYMDKGALMSHQNLEGFPKWLIGNNKFAAGPRLFIFFILKLLLSLSIRSIFFCNV